MSFIAETFIFLYVGMDTMDVEKWQSTYMREGALLFCMLLLLTLLGRAAFVFPLSAILNLRRGVRRISFRQQVIIWWSGLMRGAVSIALTFNAFTEAGVTPGGQSATIVATTIAFVLFSTAVFGLLTRPLIDWLLPYTEEIPRTDSLLSEPGSPKNGDGMRESLLRSVQDGQIMSDKLSGLPMLALPNGTSGGPTRSKLGVLLKARERDIHDLWRHFDDTFMRPYFGGRGFVPYIPGSPTVVEVNQMESRELAPEDGEIFPERSLGSISIRRSMHYERATSIEQGLAETDPAWPEIDHKHFDRRRRSDSSKHEES